MQTPKADVRKISLMIIGAQKAGTTSLKNYLGQHPALETHPHKEFSFFFDGKEFAAGYNHAYRKYFNKADSDRLLLAKNAVLYVNEGGILRLKEHNPDCKLILVLRNPVQRTYSSFLMEKNYGAIRDSIESIGPVLDKADMNDWRYACFISMSLYAESIEMIRRHFPKESLMLIRYEDLEKCPGGTCEKIFSWMGIDQTFHPDTTVRHNETRINNSTRYGKFISQLLKNDNPIKKLTRMALPGKMDYKVGEILRGINKSDRKYAPMPDAVAQRLTEYYRLYNEKLSEISGMDFSDWNNYPNQN